jgi:hypothetical protein
MRLGKSGLLWRPERLPTYNSAIDPSETNKTRYNRNAGAEAAIPLLSLQFYLEVFDCPFDLFGGFVYRIKDGLHLLDIARKIRGDLRAGVPGIKEYSKSKRIS